MHKIQGKKRRCPCLPELVRKIYHQRKRNQGVPQLQRSLGFHQALMGAYRDDVTMSIITA